MNWARKIYLSLLFILIAAVHSFGATRMVVCEEAYKSK